MLRAGPRGYRRRSGTGKEQRMTTEGDAGDAMLTRGNTLGTEPGQARHA